MLSNSPAICESRLLAHLRKMAKARGTDTISLLEVVDEAGLWEEPFQELSGVIDTLDFETFMADFPTLGCCAAAEVGFRFEGVGTVFWARFEELLGFHIPVSRRSMLAAAFVDLAKQFPIQCPAESGFNEQFSIIAWPIANALMPMEVAGPLARLLARGPRWGGSVSGRRSDLSTLRAWARTWEGLRLSEWLQNENVATRVVTAILGDNSQGALNDASFRRVTAAYARQAEAFFALREAKRRRRAETAKTTPETTEGLLSLRRISGHFALTVAWPPLPQGLLETARVEASGQAWRPRLWGQGSLLHYDQALGSLPVLLHLSTLPAPDVSAFPNAGDIFGAGTPIASALGGRVVDWVSPMVFLHDAVTDIADRVAPPLRSERGEVWLLGPLGEGAHLPVIGEVAGRGIRRADLASQDDRRVLQALGLLFGEAKSGGLQRLARHPVDAMALRRGQVRPGTPFCSFDEATLQISRLARNERLALGNVEGTRELVAASPPTDPDPGSPEVFVFERQSAFEALVEQRLLVRIDSTLGSAEWPVEAMIVSGDEILAFSRATVKQDGHGIGADSKLLRTLQSDHVRARLLETGSATLRLRVSNQPWETIALTRLEGEVNWDDADPSRSVAGATGVVTACPPKAHLFGPASAVEVPPVGASAFAVRLDDGRLASPALIVANDRFDLGDLSTNFSDLSGTRQLLAGGRGVLDLARARRAWASAVCRSMASLSTRLRVVRQFEHPLVTALCGTQWAEFERNGAFHVDPAAVLFRTVIASGAVELPEDFNSKDLDCSEASFVELISTACPRWPETDLDEEAADTALNAAFEAALAAAHAEDRHHLLDPEDFDFGAPAETWRSASDQAQLSALGSPLLSLIAPARGAEVLARRPFVTADLAEVATFLADWSTAWCLPRSHISKDLACSSLQVWLSPGAADTDAAVRQMARDAFLARAVRYVALRMAA